MKNLIRLIYHKIKHPKAKISLTSKVSLDSVLDQEVTILKHCKVGSCKIGKGTYVGAKSVIERSEIGPFTSIGSEVMCGMGSHPLNFISTYPGFYSKNASGSKWLGVEHETAEFEPVKIGADVWIGARALIMGNVNIGHGAVIAAGAIVTKDIPPFAIVGGIPAKIIRYRFNPDTIKLILESNWWNNSFETLSKVAKDSNDPIKFINQLKLNFINEN